ncbi:MAG: hypothetical protein IPM76_15490 [Chloroflexi bacterium]|nr:hypothetical protein [Chloroflexota bacterium]
MPVTNPSAGNGRDCLGLAVVIIIKGHAVFSPIIHIAHHHPLTVNVGTAVSHPTTWLNLMNYGENGRSHPIPWLNLMNYGQNGRFQYPFTIYRQPFTMQTAVGPESKATYLFATRKSPGFISRHQYNMLQIRRYTNTYQISV